MQPFTRSSQPGADPDERLISRHHGHFPGTDLVTSETGESEPDSLIDKTRFETGHQPLDKFRPVFDRQLQRLCSEIVYSDGHGCPHSTRRQRITGSAPGGRHRGQARVRRTGLPLATDWLLLALSNRPTIGEADGPTIELLRAA